VISNVESFYLIEITLILTFSRRTGRRDKRDKSYSVNSPKTKRPSASRK
jgi:hypothetical protein